MHGISIDLGSYSVKFLNYQIGKKKVKFLHSDEVIIDKEQLTEHEVSSLWDLQFKIIKEYLQDSVEDYQLMLTVPSDIVATRFINLPVKNRKKANLMLPFAIEEDLPFSLTSCHFSETLSTNGEATEAIVGIIKKDQFDIYFEYLKRSDISPRVLSESASIYSSYVAENRELYPQSFAIIDLGHSMTQAYYFENGKLASNHISYLAGSVIDEAISETYSISLEEASIYKHQNSFLLTESQYENVNENQKEFAQLMDKTLIPLINEIKRWDIGYRIKNGNTVSEIQICGGSANIKNISNYLQSKLEINVKHFNAFSFSEASEIDQDDKFRRKFSQLSCLAQGATTKSKLINFLKNEYAVQGTGVLPLQSLSFILTRVSIITLVLMASMSLEFFFMTKDIKVTDKKIKSLLKNPTLKLNGSDRRRALKKPKMVLKKLERKTKSIKQEIRSIQSSTIPNALINIKSIASILSGYDVEVIKLNSVSEGEFTLTLMSETSGELAKLKKYINQNYQDIFTDQNKKKKTLILSGTEAGL